MGQNYQAYDIVKGKSTIVNLLNKFTEDHNNITWNLTCEYSDGMGTSINQIKIIAHPGDRTIGIFSYRVETGEVLFCRYKKLKKPESEDIVDMLLDMINYAGRSKVE